MKQGSAPGDAEHPSPAARAATLLKYLQSLQLYKLTVKNDDFTGQTFVKEVLMQCLDLAEPQARDVMKEIEVKGERVFFGKGFGKRSRYLTKTEAQKIEEFVKVKKKLGNPLNGKFTCVAEPVI